MRRISSAIVVGVAACASGGGDTILDAAVLPDVVDAAHPEVDAGCAAGSSLSCACSNGGTGRRPCDQGSYGACQGCSSTSATTSGPKCVAGTYKGQLNGVYRSEPGGICGIVAGDEEPSLGEWTFSLVNDGTGEFYSVNAGCVHYGENRTELQDGGTNYAHRAELRGSVDCTTGVLTAEVRGTYVSVGKCDLGMVWTRYFYKGTMRGTFDSATQGFVDTFYELHERTPLLGPATGGSGTWTGLLAPDVDAGADAGAACLGDIQFPDDLAPQIITDGGV